MANSTPVWHDIFRYVRLLPDNVVLEADTYKDTLNILRGSGVSFGSNPASDSFEISVDYDISVPVATTKISLEDINGNLSEVNLKAGRGVAITRNSAQEIQWDTYSVTETDTLQTVTDRNNITNNDIFVNNLQVGTIISNNVEDGFSAYSGGHDLAGDGTLDNPLRFSPEYKNSIAANNTDQFTFTAPAGGGVLSYVANYVFDNAAATASVTLEREDPLNPTNWDVLDIISGATDDQVYSISGTYAEIYSAGPVNYRLTFTWTVNAGLATWFTRCTFEAGPLSPIANPQIKTNTNAKTVDINDLQFFQNNIRTTVSNTDIVLIANGSGKIVSLSDFKSASINDTPIGNLVPSTGIFSNLDAINLTAAVYTNNNIVLNNFTILTGTNAFVIGPYTIASGVSVIQQPGSTWRVL